MTRAVLHACALFVATALLSTQVVAQGGAGRGAAAPAPASSAEADIPKLSRAGEARASGPDSARVVILEFLDYACPVCAAFHNQRGDSLRKALGADVRILYVNFPLANHMRSFHGSEAAMCAASIGGKAGFTAMVDRLYRQQKDWSESNDPSAVFTRLAKDAAIDSAQFADCRARDAMSPLIIADLETASKFSIDGTPTFVMIPRGAQSADDAERASGNVPLADLMALVAKTRAKAK